MKKLSYSHFTLYQQAVSESFWFNNDAFFGVSNACRSVSDASTAQNCNCCGLRYSLSSLVSHRCDNMYYSVIFKSDYYHANR